MRRNSQGGGSRDGNGSLNGATNPWSADGWNVTQQGAIYKADAGKAAQYAKAGGVPVMGGSRPQPKG